MNDLPKDLAARYTSELRHYLATQEETRLQQAYEIGRHAIASGLGVLDTARIHQSALTTILCLPGASTVSPGALGAAEAFFLEVLAPFEATHRCFREANTQLQHLIAALEERNARLESEVAERKRLGEMWKRYESIVNNSKDFMMLISADHKYVAVNDAFCRAFGRKREDILEKSVIAVWGASAFARSINRNLERCFSGTDVHHESWFDGPTLKRHCFDLSYYPYRSDNRVSHAIVVIRDVTGRKQAEEKVVASEARLQAILDHSPALIFLKDVKGRYLHVNRQFESLFQMERAAAVGHTDRELFPPKQAAAFRANDRKVVRAGVPLEFEEVAHYQDGPHTNIVAKCPLRDAQGKIYALCGIATDITERKAAEERIRESEERLRLLISGVKDYAIYMLDTNGRVTSWNAGAERIKGYREEEILGRHFSCFYQPEDAARSKPDHDLRKALRHGHFEEENWHVRKDGSRFWASVVITAIRDPKGRLRGFAKITRDISERRAAEEKLRESKEHYRNLFNEARRMEEDLRDLSNQILSIQEEERKRISRELHDEVGQTLTGINVNLAVILRQGRNLSAALQQRIVESQELLARAAEDVHRFARELRPAMLDELGLGAALRSHVDAFAKRTGIPVKFQTKGSRVEELDGEKKTVFYRVAQESLNNIAKHAAARRVEMILEQRDGHIQLTVRDDGRGFRTNRAAPKNANKRLGLLGMQERVRLVKGVFGIESAPGKGTVVQLQIPLTAKTRDQGVNGNAGETA